MSKKQAGTITVAGRGIAEGRVGVEAVTRVGRNPQVKGVVHEVLYRDLQNASAKNVVNGTKAVLTKSTTAVRDDILMKQGTSIVGRAQLKDTPKAIAKTVSQVRSGHYAGTNLMGTTETVAAYNKAVANAAKNGVKITQQMTDTGISSLDTGRIATQTIGQAARNVHKRLRQVEYRTQSPDHPILWAADDSYYLKFYIFQVVHEK